LKFEAPDPTEGLIRSPEVAPPNAGPFARQWVKTFICQTDSVGSLSYNRTPAVPYGIWALDRICWIVASEYV